ncbi:hypothetical protein FA15DRAFT_121505 [Coprinopsis marcescibilis]|uniref:Uncharacterized protein n=1 Tax=Coprinopsis marcescibilis TaxID=230819 RepID=A0A5C3L5C9_COPMA|nr:hypothetical protein FA15DRAFT_121505 [Coprinopsis marcescibilis]
MRPRSHCRDLFKKLRPYPSANLTQLWHAKIQIVGLKEKKNLKTQTGPSRHDILIRMCPLNEFNSSRHSRREYLTLGHSLRSVLLLLSGPSSVASIYLRKTRNSASIVECVGYLMVWFGTQIIYSG